MYAIGRRSRNDSSVLRLAVDMDQPSSAGKSAAILQFTNKRQAAKQAKLRGDWWFVVPLPKLPKAKTAKTK